MATYSAYQKAGIRILLPKTGVPRNVFAKVDDIGLAGDLRRRDGESITNFRARLYSLYTRPGSAARTGLTDSIAREFDLGHETMMTVIADRSTRLDVGPRDITVVASGINTSVSTIESDVDGYWTYPAVSAVASGLNALPGLTATANSAYSSQPAVLIEEQSSYVTKYSEIVPTLSVFRLGEVEDSRPLTGTVVPESISFTDDTIFGTRVSATPSAAGEWSVDITSGRISSYLMPEIQGRVTYTYNLLESGVSMSLIGNGVRVINLSNLDMQHLVVTSSGITITGEGLLTELYRVDGSTWGK